LIDLKGKNAVVTGAARGIGKAIALHLAESGCNVMVSDIDETGAQAVADKIKELGVNAVAIKSDVSNLADAEKMIEKAVADLGSVDILVNNAGITRDTLLMRMSEADWDAVININLKGTFNCIKAATRQLLKQRAGKIINMASVVGVMGNAGQANYSASKAGVIGLTKSVAKEFGARNIQVNAIAPGYIETDMTKDLPASAKEMFLTGIPLKRAGQVKDVSNAVLFLASDLSDYVTGQVLHVDGGMVM
jgi:3-oxoacyl-[acyl-carrier protein] reductase